MSHNRFGHLFCVAGWGESHGESIGCVVDGVPPGLALCEGDVQKELDRRRPGRSRHVTQRREPDRVKILSGLHRESEADVLRTTGAPIAMKIDNVDARSKDYADLSDRFRPGHADYVYFAKYGLRDPRGGGRSSARETAVRVAAGAVARKILDPLGVVICGALVQIGERRVNREACDWGVIDDNPFFCPDAETAELWSEDLDRARRDGSSLGACVEIVARGAPPGWGAPLYGKLDADLAAAMMSINAVKGVEIGDGMNAAALDGRNAADLMIGFKDGVPIYDGNHAGGIVGGLSTGQDIVVRFAVKPTSSIASPRPGFDRRGRPVEIAVRGRHDPCVGIRAVPVGEAMMACTLADHYLRHRAQTGRDGAVKIDVTDVGADVEADAGANAGRS